MTEYTIDQIKSIISDISYQISGNIEVARFKNAKPLDAATEESLVWLSPNKKNKEELIKKIPSYIIICDNDVNPDEATLRNKCLIQVDNPKYVFSRIVSELFQPKFESQIHPTAVIHPEASIHFV